MAEREAPEDFDYLFEDPTDPAPDGEQAEDQQWDGFDAFDTNTWYFEPTPTPWYRTRRAMLGLGATAAASVAIVVSGVLLVFQGSGTAVEDISDEPRVTPTAPTSAAPSTAPTRLVTSAPPPPPAPPPASAAPIERAPVQTRPRTPSSRTTKEPEIGVTRTPATRSPISVAPQRPNSQR